MEHVENIRKPDDEGKEQHWGKWNPAYMKTEYSPLHRTAHQDRKSRKGFLFFCACFWYFVISPLFWQGNVEAVGKGCRVFPYTDAGSLCFCSHEWQNDEKDKMKVKVELCHAFIKNVA